MGFTDAVIHAQGQRLKGMLDSWPQRSTVSGAREDFQDAA